MKEITPGTLCLVVGYASSPENLGRSVVAKELVKKGERIFDGSRFIGPADSSWVAEAEGLTLIRNGKKIIHNYAHFMPDHLLPIPPKDDEIVTKQQEEKPCTA